MTAFPEWSRQIKALRKALGLSQQKLAERIEISKKVLADWEQGAQEPSPRRYIQLAKIARGEQVFWFLEQIELDRQFLESLAHASHSAAGRSRPR